MSRAGRIVDAHRAGDGRGATRGRSAAPHGGQRANDLVLLSTGAIATRVRAGDEAIAALPALVTLALAPATLALQVA